MARGQLLTMSSLTGSIGGLTFRNGKGANVISAKKVGKVKNSPLASSKRTVLTYFSQSWRNMTQATRRQWRSLHYRHMTGYQLYMYCRLNLFACNTIAAVTPQPPPRFPALTIIQLNSTAGGLKQVRIANLPSPAVGFYAEVQCTNPVSPGIEVVKDSLFRTVIILDAPMSGFFTATTQYNAVFGTDAGMRGQRVFIRARFVHKLGGYASPWLYGNSIIS